MTIVEDRREIKALWMHNGDGFVADESYAGRIYATRITAYSEYGQMEGVPWFEVWKGDVVVSRVNGSFVVSIDYAEAKP